MRGPSTRRLAVGDLGAAHWAAVVRALLTGVLHLYAGAVDARVPLLVAELGFIGGVGVFLAGYRSPRLYLTVIAYTAFQVVAWAIVNAGDYTVLGYADKVVQLGRVAVLVALARRG